MDGEIWFKICSFVRSALFCGGDCFLHSPDAAAASVGKWKRVCVRDCGACLSVSLSGGRCRGHARVALSVCPPPVMISWTSERLIF